MELVPETGNTEANTKPKTVKNNCSKIDMRRLRLSLRFRPEIFKLILKMRLIIRRKKKSIKILKEQLKTVQTKPTYADAYTQTDIEVGNIISDHQNTEDASAQRENGLVSQSSRSAVDQENKTAGTGWNLNTTNETSKSIADQVKEAAQSVLQQSGMVYVESAGMYYDYKSGYYYNSELGLYYHTDTECYYYYSEEQKNFVFHSYPDRSASATSVAVMNHKEKRGKKNKKDKKCEDAIENLTKNLSQDKEDASDHCSSAKRRKTTKKEKVIDKKKLTEAKDAKEKKAKAKKESEDKKDDIFETIDEFNDEKNLNNAEDEKEELEDGECSDSDEEVDAAKSDSDDDATKSETSASSSSDDESVSRRHPPCMRVIVKETTVPKLKVGSLYLVTKDGGTVGREGDHHSILIRDTNVSRNHLDIRYDQTLKNYVAMDLGSRNGTILNGNRMSESQKVSKPMEVVHGSTIQLGETKLLCHVHRGNDTCGHCEPGLLMENEEKKQAAYTRTCSVQKQHQLELARLRNKYAPPQLAIEETAYNDRAAARRQKVGSSHHSEKTQSADVGTYITPDNKGFKLLQKMGWSKGEGLGKQNQGDIEPIPLISNEGKAGLGAAPDMPCNVSNILGPATMRLIAKSKMLDPQNYLKIAQPGVKSPIPVDLDEKVDDTKPGVLPAGAPVKIPVKKLTPKAQTLAPPAKAFQAQLGDSDSE